MLKSKPVKIISALVGLVLAAVLIYQIPAVNTRLSWRIDVALTYLRGVVQPVEAIPTPEAVFVPPTQMPTSTSTTEPTLTASPLPPGTDTPNPTLIPSATPTATAIPERVSLPAPDWVIDATTVFDVLAIEIYWEPNVPGEFKRFTTCGAVNIWTGVPPALAEG